MCTGKEIYNGITRAALLQVQDDLKTMTLDQLGRCLAAGGKWERMDDPKQRAMGAIYCKQVLMEFERRFMEEKANGIR